MVELQSGVEADPTVERLGARNVPREEHVSLQLHPHLEHRRADLRVLAILTTLVLATGCSEPESKPPADPRVAQYDDFAKRLAAYMQVRDSVEDIVGDLDPTKSQAEIATRASTLAAAIIAARPNAKPGDIFTPEIATVLATMIKEEYGRRPDTVQETRGDAQDELPNFEPKVNSLYPTTYPLATFPPKLLPLLPPLPDKLEYRIVQDYLVLRDIEANIIIDFMPNAVPV